jgi:serine/threonine-protein kinase RsbW
MTTPSGSDPCSFTAQLPFDTRAAAHARGLVRDLLSSQVAPGSQVIADAALVLDELVSNAVKHGASDRKGKIEVAGKVEGDALVLSVLDEGSEGTVAAIPFSDDAAHGRGLSIVDALSTTWRVDRSRGTRVTALMRLQTGVASRAPETTGHLR